MKYSSAGHRALEYAAVPAFHDNYIWVISNGRDAVVIDPGDEAPVRTYLRARRVRLSAILLTHHHGDHTGGVLALAGEQDIPVYGPASEKIPGVTHPVREKSAVRIKTLGLIFSVLEVPGHTLGHIAFLLPGSPSEPSRLFCGDTLFACGCGRLFEGTPRQMLASLDKLAALPESTRVYCAHEYTLANIRFARACEPENAELHHWQHQAEMRRAEGVPTVPTTIGHERRVNPFFRLNAPGILRYVNSPARAFFSEIAQGVEREDSMNRDRCGRSGSPSYSDGGDPAASPNTASASDVVQAAEKCASRRNDRLAVFTALRACKDNFA